MRRGQFRFDLIGLATLGVIILTLCASPPLASATPKGELRIAVLELSNPAGLSQQEVTYLSDLMRRLAASELAQRFLVMTKANMLTLLPADRPLEECIGECAIETGRLLSATYIITGDIIRFGKQLRVSVKLHDTRSGRLIGSEVASGRELTDMETGIQEAGGRLLRRLMKGGSAQSTGESERRRIGGEQSKSVGSARRRVIVTLRSDPTGAGVTVDGVQKCQEGSISCQIELSEGAHQVRMSKTEYFERSGSVSVSADRREVTWELDPNFATLEVVTSPSSLRFTVNGDPHTASISRRIEPGKKYAVVSADPCFGRGGEEIKAGKPGDNIVVRLAPPRLYATLDVSARDPEGHPLTADVYVDGDEVGETPGQFQVSVCAQALRLSHSVHGEDETGLSLSAGTVKREVVTLNDSVGARTKRLQFWAWVSTAMALASVGSIIYGYVGAGDAQDQFPSTVDDSARYDELKGDFDTAKIFSYGGIVGAALFTGGAITLFAVGADLKKRGARATLSPTQGGALASFVWRW